MKKLFPILILTAVISGCKPTWSTEEYVDWLYSRMSLPDSISHSREWYTANVQKTLDVRKEMGWNIPEKEFLHFVLPLRVNNEALDDFRTTYADTLCRRVKGLSLADAALEVNHWCHEQAIYRGSDARTSPPMATVHNGAGRCGEESVLAVAALRAAGIPARQVYTPRWAHTDDNHAWVEVWADGKWWFMGACEPEAKLNMAWFNGPVSRAMLLHTLAYGDYDGPEDVIRRTPTFTEINVISGYVPARRNIVTVIDESGSPVPGATVQFKIYNYAEFYTVATYNTDDKGQTSLNTGYGDIFVWAAKNGKFGFGVCGSETIDGSSDASADRVATIRLDHSWGDVFSADVNIVPPAENPIPSSATEEELELNRSRLAAEDAIRASHDHSNHAVEAFRESAGKATGKNAYGVNRKACAEELLGLLTAKDLDDVTEDVLTDALENAVSLDPYVLNPRVTIEPLLPYRAEILEGLGNDKPINVSEAISWVKKNIKVENGRNPRNLRTAPVNVWRARVADVTGRNIFFVALCRTLGFPARIDEVTGKTQYRNGDVWVDVNFGDAVEGSGSSATETITPQGNLALSYKVDGNGIKAPMYYRHFTIAQIGNGNCLAKLMEFGADSDVTPVSEFANGVDLDAGYYMVTSGTRLADGSVLAHLEFVNVPVDGKVDVPLTLRKDSDALAVIGTMDAENKFTNLSGEKQSILSATGRGWFLLAVLGDKDEPTTHAIADFRAIASELNEWGRPVVILDAVAGKVAAGKDKTASESKLGTALTGAVYGYDADGSVRSMLSNGCEKPSAVLPIITVCDSFGKIVYFSQGYNTSLGSDLKKVVAKLNQ